MAISGVGALTLLDVSNAITIAVKMLLSGGGRGSTAIAGGAGKENPARGKWGVSCLVVNERILGTPVKRRVSVNGGHVTRH